VTRSETVCETKISIGLGRPMALTICIPKDPSGPLFGHDGVFVDDHAAADLAARMARSSRGNCRRLGKEIEAGDPCEAQPFCTSGACSEPRRYRPIPAFDP
jgi:hypothetical protein